MGWVLIITGIALVLIGVAFAMWHRGSETAGVSAFKINVSGASWLILVVLGSAMIAGAWYLDGDHEPDKEPASDVPVSTISEASFAESSPDEPYAFGDDGTLDALQLSCGSGAMQACDDLYQQSPVGSEYESFGATCGARFDDPPEVCVDAPIDDTSGSA